MIVDLVRKRGAAKKDFSDHMRIRTDYPTQSLRVWVGRDIDCETHDPVLDVWKVLPPRKFPNYAAGSWGPKEADDLTHRDAREWRNIGA